MVVTCIKLAADGRRPLLKLQFHVPRSQFIEEKSGFAGLGTGVLSIVGLVAAKAIDPIAASTTAIATSVRTHRNVMATSSVQGIACPMWDAKKSLGQKGRVLALIM